MNSAIADDIFSLNEMEGWDEEQQNEGLGYEEEDDEAPEPAFRDDN